MPSQLVTLDYDQIGFKANPDQVPVKPGDIITFQLGSSAPANSVFTITIHDPSLFSSPGGTGSHAKAVEVTLKSTLAGPITYDCELRDASGQLLSKSGGSKPGGGMKLG